jgi:hypothetical protein
MSSAPVEQQAPPPTPASPPNGAPLHDEHELIMHLEPDQLVAETFRPVARARLGRKTTLALWALRVFAVLVSLMVLYTFVQRLH